MYKKIFILILMLFSVNLVYSMQSGLNYYDEFQDSLNIPSPNKTYKLAFTMDDIGTAVNTPTIADIDNDGVNELIIPEYSGKLRIWNWSGMIKGQREAIDSVDRGTYYITTAQKITENGIDNNGNGYLEMAMNDYNGYLRVLEYDGTNINSIYNEPSDRGYYRNSPVWCDIDGDGDYDIFTCSYDGKCRLYIYDSGTYTLNFTDSDRGTYYTDNSPICADLDNDGDKDLAINTYEGYLQLYEWNNGLTRVAQYGDVGSYYNSPNYGDFLGNGKNYIITFSSDGKGHAYNCTSGLGSCSLMDVSNDVGSFVYGSSEFSKIKIGSKDYLIGLETYGKMILAELVDSTSLTLTQVGLDIDDQSYSRIGLANGYNYTLRASRYTTNIAIDKYNGNKDWDTIRYTKDIQGKYFSKYYYNGFLYGDGFVCGQLDYNTPEDECVIISYEGIPYVFTLQNITEYRQEVNSDYELTYLDIMPRNAIHYLIKGNSNTYCVNEDRNVLKMSLGGGKIKSWANVYNSDGSAILNYERITDGILSTNSRFNNQNGGDYTSWNAGTDKSMEFNMSKPVQLGEIKFWGYFGDGRDTYNLKIQISNTSCDNPNFITIFNESNGDISGSNTHAGLKVRFKPQEVQCIKITASGSYDGGINYISSNYITELAGYYANNCTFYTVPLDKLNAKIGSNYNISSKIYEETEENSPNQIDSDYQGAYRNTISFILNVIDRIIIWIKKY